MPLYYESQYDTIRAILNGNQGQCRQGQIAPYQFDRWHQECLAQAASLLPNAAPEMVRYNAEVELWKLLCKISFFVDYEVVQLTFHSCNSAKRERREHAKVSWRSPFSQHVPTTGSGFIDAASIQPCLIHGGCAISNTTNQVLNLHGCLSTAPYQPTISHCCFSPSAIWCYQGCRRTINSTHCQRPTNCSYCHCATSCRVQPSSA